MRKFSLFLMSIFLFSSTSLSMAAPQAHFYQKIITDSGSWHLTLTFTGVEKASFIAEDGSVHAIQYNDPNIISSNTPTNIGVTKGDSQDFNIEYHVVLEGVNNNPALYDPKTPVCDYIVTATGPGKVSTDIKPTSINGAICKPLQVVINGSAAYVVAEVGSPAK